MANGFYNIPIAVNEPVKEYKKNSSERIEVLDEYKKMYNNNIDIPMYIGDKKVYTQDKRTLSPPHDHSHEIGTANYGSERDVENAIEAAMKAQKDWSNMNWEHRASIFLKAADLLAGPFRSKLNAATMIAQSKNVMQAEIDAACELIDFFKFNVQYMSQLYKEQPESQAGMWNRLEHRPLEGFIFALTPFNFTSICANLCAAPAMLGNVIIWKPAETQIYSANVIMELFKAAGLPDGVINMVTVDGKKISKVIFENKNFAGLHFTGSTNVFRTLWKNIGDNIQKYKSYPRIVGETGGKDFIIAHKSAIADEVATAISRGAFEYQGQKCSAASRAYIPQNLWQDIKIKITDDIKNFKIGSPEDPNNFINSVISEKAFDKITSYIEYAKQSDDAEIISGGSYDKSTGYFIEPTVIVTSNPKFKTMVEEIFGPVITIYIYNTEEWDLTLDLLESTSEYALTGAIFSLDRYAIQHATKKLENAAGNFYINDKPTGAVVGQQPFGGARGSGTNDKAGSILNLLRWVSPRTIKETFVPAKDYRYPFLD
ncbi:MAG: 1-pyrroline-5-carboxylate dehydrogenase [Flavobacteriales bacterium]|nr:1-pyrroline-5-carboxylate dehydrogenase [Flavobacteriales bacterium]|tara:strand:- start:12901 stop:14526 length:1626 start_codon:yes stop_codon:yes gene_type:complete